MTTLLHGQLIYLESLVAWDNHAKWVLTLVFEMAIQLLKVMNMLPCMEDCVKQINVAIVSEIQEKICITLAKTYTVKPLLSGNGVSGNHAVSGQIGQSSTNIVVI